MRSEVLLAQAWIGQFHRGAERRLAHHGAGVVSDDRVRVWQAGLGTWHPAVANVLSEVLDAAGPWPGDRSAERFTYLHVADGLCALAVA